MAKMNDLPDVVAYLFAKGLDDFYNPLENGEWKNVDIMEENYMYGDYTQSDDEDEEFDLYGGNYCEVEFNDRTRGVMTTIADFDIESFREEGTNSLSFGEGIICGITPDSVFSITRLSEQEYLDIVG